MREASDDIDVVPVPLDRETRARLVRIAQKVGKSPTACATELLVDLIWDEEFANINALAPHRLN